MPQTAPAEQELAAASLLAALPADSFAAVARHLEAFEAAPRQTIYEIGGRVTHAYFPAGGCVLTGVALMSDGATVETLMAGREAAAGLAALFADRRARHWTRVLLPGACLRVPGDALRELFARDEAVRRLLLGCYRALLAQATRRALCNTSHRLFERFCTWLLMVRARAGRDDLPLTQEAAARHLGVRRAGVNEAVGRLQRAGAVEHGRGRVRVLDAARLEAAACLCYRSSGAGVGGPGPASPPPGEDAAGGGSSSGAGGRGRVAPFVAPF